MTLTDRFLRAKHWQLFTLTFGIPMIFQITMVVSMLARISNGAKPDPSTFLSYFSVFPVLMIIFVGTFFGWLWSLATGLQNKIPANVKMKTGRFKVFFFIPITYMLLLSIGMGTAMSGVFQSGGEHNVGAFAGSMAIIFPLHLFSMFCIFYCLYFVSKTLKTVELQRETTFSDFAGEFFLIWFYPIGIWVLQPKINKMVGSTQNITS
jgi:hypothetical protein